MSGLLSKTCKCGEPCGDNGRCKECNAVTVRIARELKGYDEEFKKTYLESLKAEGRADFMQQCRGKYGDQLMAMITHRVERYMEESGSVTFQGTGEFYDDVELAHHRAAKPFCTPEKAHPRQRRLRGSNDDSRSRRLSALCLPT